MMLRGNGISCGNGLKIFVQYCIDKQCLFYDDTQTGLKKHFIANKQ